MSISRDRNEPSNSGTSRARVRSGRGGLPEEPGAHVVFEAEDLVAGADEMRDRLRSDEPAGACDDRYRHGA